MLNNNILSGLVVCAVLGTQASAQSSAEPQQGNLPTSDEFQSDAAILDTAIPFAIGSRQAQQQLRGSFGWPTYQEGVVEGIYFRFDPDGFARFSTEPRLDTDVFEVICRPRTRSCRAEKDSLRCP